MKYIYYYYPSFPTFYRKNEIAQQNHGFPLLSTCEIDDVKRLIVSIQDDTVTQRTNICTEYPL